MLDRQNDDIDSFFSTAELLVRASISRLSDSLKTYLEPAAGFNFLQVMTGNTRAPRIALYGKSDSDKSDLINVLVGETINLEGVSDNYPSWLEYEHENWPLYFAGIKSPSETTGNLQVADTIDFIVNKRVDLLLCIIPPDMANLSQPDIAFLHLLQMAYLEKFEVELPIIFVFTTDEPAATPRNWIIPHDSTSLLEAPCVTVCTAWKSQEDRIENTAELVMAIINALPDLARFGFAAGTGLPTLKRVISRNLAWTTAAFAGAVCFVPAPLADLASIRPVQVKLVSLIARMGGCKEDSEQIPAEFIRQLNPHRLGTTLFMVGNQIGKIAGPLGLPVSITNASNSTGSTLALGEAAIAYFIDGLPIEDAKYIFENYDLQMKTKFRQEISQSSKKLGPGEVYRIFKELGTQFTKNPDRYYLRQNISSKARAKHLTISKAV